MNKEYFEDMEVEFAMDQDDAYWANYLMEQQEEVDKLINEFRYAASLNDVAYMNVVITLLDNMCEWDTIEMLQNEYNSMTKEVE